MMNLSPDVLATIERVKREGAAQRAKGIQGRFAQQHKICSNLSGKKTDYQEWVIGMAAEHLED